MRFKIIARMRGSKDCVATEKFEFQSLLAASQFHGDFWNTHFAFTDRFRSTLYLLNDLSNRWQKTEMIN
jgi:hypothetical protein